MKFLVKFSASGRKTFLALPKQIREMIAAKMKYFVNGGTPLSFAKKLKSIDNKYRFRIGDYRVIFQPEKNVSFIILLVLKVGHRKDIYS